MYEVPYAAVPPALIHTGKWNGKLYLGSISAAICEDWTRWAGVTHVVCVLGQFADRDRRVVAQEWIDAHKYRYREIC